MLRRTKIVMVTVTIAMLVTTWGMVGTAAAQKAAVPKPLDRLALGEDEVMYAQGHMNEVVQND